MNKIKVCHIITMLELGGAQRNTLYTLANLDRDRFVTVLICGKGGTLDAEARSSASFKTYFLNGLVRPVKPLKDLLCVFSILKILRAERPDVVHTHSSKAGILGRIAAWLAGIPVVVHTFHGFGFNDFQNPLTRAVYVFAEKITAPLADRFIAVTNEDITKGLRYGIGPAEKYSLIRSGIDISRYSSLAMDKNALKREFGLPQDTSVVTTIGPFKPQKNLGDFVRASAVILKSFPRAYFLVAGDGEQKHMLKELIGRLGLEGKVILLGWRGDTDKILSVTDVFVMTSLWEGLPRSILEAMSSGLPVVANAVDGVKEIVKDGTTGYLVEPRDIGRLAEKTAYLLNNPAAAKEMGKKARAAIDAQYDIRNMVKEQERLYLELMEKYAGAK